jgi:hypothetical protein
MLTIALIISISIMNNSFSQVEENIQEQQKIKSSHPGTQNLTEKYE